MADFNKPQVSDPYGDVLQAVRELLAECAKFQDGSSNTNVPTGAVRFSSTNKRFEKWNGSSWIELIAKASDKYDINVDRVDGYDAGNGSGQIPVSNGTVNANLNADLLDGNHASAFALAAPNGQGGVRRLYRNDDGSAYNVQTYWTGTRWRLRGYNGDTFHAESEVSYADSAGTAGYVSSISSAVGTAYTWSARQVFNSGGESWSSTGDQGKLEVRASGNTPAFMAFHRPGAWATYFGLDTDNQFKYGGWSAGGPHTFWTTANFDPGVKANASTSLQKSGDTASELYNNGWFRSNGNVGWYSQTYGGGIWMNDASWVRVYGGKGFLTDWHQFHSGGNIWTSSYGWLHDRFAAASHSINVHQYSGVTGDGVAGGATPNALVQIASDNTVRIYRNTNCNCNCNCGNG